MCTALKTGRKMLFSHCLYIKIRFHSCCSFRKKQYFLCQPSPTHISCQCSLLFVWMLAKRIFLEIKSQSVESLASQLNQETSNLYHITKDKSMRKKLLKINMQKAHYSNLPTHKENHLSMDPLQIVTFKQIILLLNMCQISNHLTQCNVFVHRRKLPKGLTFSFS